ncbi:autotransporter outer membrane beta-barrel domain-containing protein [Ectothiorhodospiraceae bacterium WFHF3C12]|nr:autotransporter outer membrane beta-barrel domain-containing protein [Ectothiorhodospiraceae bacterium WFHF3C12]
MISGQAGADLQDLPGLTDPQREAAIASMTVYTALRPEGEEGVLPPEQQVLFDRIEELVHTANELLETPNEPTDRSLQLDAEGLAESLQWVSTEETAAQGRLAKDTATSQFSNVARRLGELRLGGGGLQLGRLEGDARPAGFALSSGDGRIGGGASADEYAFSRWGAFLNGVYGVSRRDPTDREDAYDADNFGLSAGVDYRLSDALVLGGGVGWSRAEIDFDGSRSTVDGGVDADGYSLSLYGLYDVGWYYVNGIVTYGALDYDLTRRITYPSNNPAVAPVNETARADTDGRQSLIGLSIGAQHEVGAASAGGFLRLDFVDIRVDGYRERNAGPFNLEVDDQQVQSLRSSLGVEGAYRYGTDFGVLLPSVRTAWVHEFRDDSRNVDVGFAADPTGAVFATTTDKPDRDFFTVAGSLAMVLPRGVQAFVDVETVLGLRDTDSTQFVGGVRMEF